MSDMAATANLSSLLSGARRSSELIVNDPTQAIPRFADQPDPNGVSYPTGSLGGEAAVANQSRLLPGARTSELILNDPACCLPPINQVTPGVDYPIPNGDNDFDGTNAWSGVFDGPPPIPAAAAVHVKGSPIPGSSSIYVPDMGPTSGSGDMQSFPGGTPNPVKAGGTPNGRI